MEDAAPKPVNMAVEAEDWHLRHEHRRTLMRFAPFPLLGTLPNELLLHIFSYLLSADLYHVACTCWTFYNLSVKEIHKDVTFNMGNERVLYSSRIWRLRTPEMDRVPITLTLSSTKSNTFGSLYNRFQSFISLKSLMFSNMDLLGSTRVYEVLPLFPNLRRLSFVKCLLPQCPAATAATFVNLPIEELDIIFITWEAPSPPMVAHFVQHQNHMQMWAANLHGMQHNPQAVAIPGGQAHHQPHHVLLNQQGVQQPAVPHAVLPGPPLPGPLLPTFHFVHQPNPANLFHAMQAAQFPALPEDALVRFGALNLASAPNLRILRLDWSDTIATYVFNENLMRHPPCTARLHTLELRGLDETKAIGGNLHEYLTSTTRLLRESPLLERLGLMPDTRLKRLPFDFELKATHTYRGPLESFGAFRIAETVRHVVGLNEIHATRLAACFPIGLPRVESVELRLQAWDIEVLHCAVYAFPSVRDLRIKYYGADEPSEHTLVSFPYEFLPRLPSLSVLHIYGLGSARPKGKVFRDGFRFMGKKLRNLVEVRLQAGAVWRRASVQDDDWCMRIDGHDADDKL
ncbi:hypothetical protein CPB85DRAFT_280095 [Mucidula mucida]|nr:hypothetical protein CPB85DRAFT_280095 [Mucidula mucida]